VGTPTSFDFQFSPKRRNQLVTHFSLLENLDQKMRIAYKDNPEVDGWCDDTLDVFMRLHKHIPSILPAFGKKLQIRYKGQPVLCSKCLNQGHIRRNCTSPANNWMGFVKYCVDSGAFSINMFGSWYEYLNDHQAVVNSQAQQ